MVNARTKIEILCTVNVHQEDGISEIPNTGITAKTAANHYGINKKDRGSNSRNYIDDDRVYDAANYYAL